MSKQKASEIIRRLSGSIGETGRDVEVHFVLDVEKWHPPLTLHLFEVDGALPEKYGVTFRFTTGGQYAVQTDEGHRFRRIAARAWAKHILVLWDHGDTRRYRVGNL